MFGARELCSTVSLQKKYPWSQIDTDVEFVVVKVALDENRIEENGGIDVTYKGIIYPNVHGFDDPTLNTSR